MMLVNLLSAIPFVALINTEVFLSFWNKMVKNQEPLLLQLEGQVYAQWY